jgi:hypothetical protein
VRDVEGARGARSSRRRDTASRAGGAGSSPPWCSCEVGLPRIVEPTAVAIGVRGQRRCSGVRPRAVQRATAAARRELRYASSSPKRLSARARAGLAGLRGAGALASVQCSVRRGVDRVGSPSESEVTARLSARSRRAVPPGSGRRRSTPAARRGARDLRARALARSRPRVGSEWVDARNPAWDCFPAHARARDETAFEPPTVPEARRPGAPLPRRGRTGRCRSVAGVTLVARPASGARGHGTRPARGGARERGGAGAVRVAGDVRGARAGRSGGRWRSTEAGAARVGALRARAARGCGGPRAASRARRVLRLVPAARGGCAARAARGVRHRVRVDRGVARAAVARVHRCTRCCSNRRARCCRRSIGDLARSKHVSGAALSPGTRLQDAWRHVHALIAAQLARVIPSGGGRAPGLGRAGADRARPAAQSHARAARVRATLAVAGAAARARGPETARCVAVCARRLRARALGAPRARRRRVGGIAAGCGVTFQGPPELVQRGGGPCGTGMVPEESARFLHFYRAEELADFVGPPPPK